MQLLEKYDLRSFGSRRSAEQSAESSSTGYYLALTEWFIYFRFDLRSASTTSGTEDGV
jgi:hypothetical protein